VQALLSLRAIRKEFPGCLANDDVDLDVLPGEIHALLGENGAGKSTLVKMIYGVLKPDNGEMAWNGQSVGIETPSAARSLGIGMVFQHFSLFEALTVSENISLGIPKEIAGPGLDERIIEVSKSYGLPLDPHREVHSLSVGERQRIEIVRCLLQNPKLLIMDEPTSVLTPQEADKLFETLERLSSEGVAILYISHRLEEIRKLCHKATILRLGRVVADCDPSEETARSLAELMMGSDLTLPEKAGANKPGPVRFKVSNLSAVPSDPFGVPLNDISFELRAGEILGIGGLAGNGQAELMDMLSGEQLAETHGSIYMDEVPVGNLGPRERRDFGLGFVPEERLGHGAVPDMTLWENGFLSAMSRQDLIQNGFIKIDKSIEFAKNVVNRFKVKTVGVDHFATSLSGGNLQKFIVGREIEQNPRVLVVLQPTWGVDAGSAAAIHQELMDLAANGSAVLVISQDLDELFAVSDRISVICEGRLSDSSPASETTVEQIGLLMGGIHGDQPIAEGVAS
jgi:ABC-type uncharacterized transport system ATPase subunit